jgi:hypothetical protein
MLPICSVRLAAYVLTTIQIPAPLAQVRREGQRIMVGRVVVSVVFVVVVISGLYFASKFIKKL